MIVDCDDCTVRGDACGDCVMTVVLGLPRRFDNGGVPGVAGTVRIDLEQEERDALAVLAEQGLIPRLRLVGTALPRPEADPGTTGVSGENCASG